MVVRAGDRSNVFNICMIVILFPCGIFGLYISFPYFLVERGKRVVERQAEYEALIEAIKQQVTIMLKNAQTLPVRWNDSLYFTCMLLARALFLK